MLPERLQKKKKKLVINKPPNKEDNRYKLDAKIVLVRDKIRKIQHTTRTFQADKITDEYLSNSSIQQSPPSARTRAPASNIHSPKNKLIGIS